MKSILRVLEGIVKCGDYVFMGKDLPTETGKIGQTKVAPPLYLHGSHHGENEKGLQVSALQPF